MKKRLIPLSFLALAGCFTLHESEYPDVRMSSCAREEIKVQLAGFDATVTTYIPVYGYETVFHSGYGHRRRHGGWMSTYMTETYVPQTSATSAYIDRATDTLEKSGFVVKTDKPEFRIEVKFSGPFITVADRSVSAAWSLLSLFSADYGVQTWEAKLKIYEISSGKLIMGHDYHQRYQAVVWGPIPIFSPGCSELTTCNAMQSWCLSALTDKVMADATSFLAGRK